MKPKVREAKRTTLLIAALAIAVTATAIPAFAGRDPGLGMASGSGMGLYNYGATPPRLRGMATNYRLQAPTPPRMGQNGLSGQYADGMHLYQFVRSNPIKRLDPRGTKSIELKSITMKRKHIKWKVVVGLQQGDGYGHWWTELEGTESYGWWPKRPVQGLVATLKGVTGELNGQTNFGGTPKQDPHHGDAAEEKFHPWRAEDGWTIWGLGARKLEFGPMKGARCSCVGERAIRDCIRAFVKDFSSKNSLWRYPLSPNCHSFQKSIMEVCCMTKTKDD